MNKNLKEWKEALEKRFDEVSHTTKEFTLSQEIDLPWGKAKIEAKISLVFEWVADLDKVKSYVLVDNTWITNAAETEDWIKTLEEDFKKEIKRFINEVEEFEKEGGAWDGWHLMRLREKKHLA